MREGVIETNSYLKSEPDATDKPSATTYQKLVGAFRQLSLSIGSDSVSEYTRLAKSTLHECRERFVKEVCRRY